MRIITQLSLFDFFIINYQYIMSKKFAVNVFSIYFWLIRMIGYR